MSCSTIQILQQICLNDLQRHMETYRNCMFLPSLTKYAHLNLTDVLCLVSLEDNCGNWIVISVCVLSCYILLVVQGTVNVGHHYGSMHLGFS